MHFELQGDQIKITVLFWYLDLVKSDLSERYSKIICTEQVTSYKVLETHSHV